jgi:hypothetical protein
MYAHYGQRFFVNWPGCGQGKAEKKAFFKHDFKQGPLNIYRDDCSAMGRPVGFGRRVASS